MNTDDEIRTPEETRAAFRLRPERPPVTRLSRKVVAGLVGVGSAAVLGAGFWALRDGEQTAQPREELFSTDAKPSADKLATLPKDYADAGRDVPQLGPPLPGDLGRPIVSAGLEPASAGDVISGPGAYAVGPSQPDPREQEAESARTSRLFVAASPSGMGAAPPDTVSLSPAGEVPVAAPSGGFAEGAFDASAESPERLRAPSSPNVVQAGTVIPAALITGIRSDLAGLVTAQVTQNVHDSPTGRTVLIPQGSRLIGAYDAEVGFGQRRVFLVWTRLILPDGRSILLEKAPAGDAQGFSGLEDGVDFHVRRLFGAAVLSSILGMGAAASDSAGSDVAQAMREGLGGTVNQAGQQAVSRTLDMAPTLTIRPGYPVRVIVNRDLVLDG